MSGFTWRVIEEYITNVVIDIMTQNNYSVAQVRFYSTKKKMLKWL